MPILQASGVITPGQFGPISRDSDPDNARLTLTMSSTGMPSVISHDQRHLRVDRLQDRVGGKGWRHVNRVAGVPGWLLCLCITVSNTGRFKCLVPPLPGVTPPMTLVP